MVGPEGLAESRDVSLEQLIQQRLSHELSRGGGPGALISVRPLTRHLPRTDSRSRVFRCGIAPPSPQWGGRVIAKYVSPQDAPAGDAAEYDMLVRLHAAATFIAAGFTVPAPIAHFPEIGVVVMGELEGEPLHQAFSTPNPAAFGRLAALAERCGRMLRSCHDINRLGTSQGVPAEIFHTIVAQVERLPIRAGRREALRGRLQEACDHAAASASGAVLTLVRRHGDFGLHNVFVAGNRLGMLDFAYSAPDLIFNDLGSFLTSLDTRRFISATLGLPPVTVWRNRFLAGYFGDEPHLDGRTQILLALYSIRQILFRYGVEAENQRRRGCRALGWHRVLFHERALGRELARIRRSAPSQPEARRR